MRIYLGKNAVIYKKGDMFQVMEYDYSYGYSFSLDELGDNHNQFDITELKKVKLCSEGPRTQGYCQIVLMDINNFIEDGIVYKKAVVIANNCNKEGYELQAIYPINENGDISEEFDVEDPKTYKVLGAFPNPPAKGEEEAFLEKLCKEVLETPYK